jgi:hypothetical protein
LDALTISPSHSRGQGRGESAKLFAVASFSQSRFDAPLADAFSAPRMLTRRDPFSDLVEPSPNRADL